jgi:hypothetical protein
MMAKTLRVIRDLLLKINVRLLEKKEGCLSAPLQLSYRLLFFSQFF